MARDMTRREFEAACERRGFRRIPLGMGYYALPDTPVQVYARNGGRRRRDQLAYLIREHEKVLAEETARNP